MRRPPVRHLSRSPYKIFNTPNSSVVHPKKPQKYSKKVSALMGTCSTLAPVARIETANSSSTPPPSPRCNIRAYSSNGCKPCLAMARSPFPIRCSQTDARDHLRAVRPTRALQRGEAYRATRRRPPPSFLASPARSCLARRWRHSAPAPLRGRRQTVVPSALRQR
jgi:hypothetical protein